MSEGSDPVLGETAEPTPPGWKEYSQPRNLNMDVALG